MADPVSMGIMAAGTAATAFGQYQSGQAAKQAGAYNLEAAKREQEGLEIQAGQEIAVASHRAQEIARRAKALMGSQKVAASAGGQSSTDMSAVAIEQETVKTSSLDQLMEMAQAEERAQQIRHRGEVVRSEGEYAKWQGKQRAKAANIAAVGTLLEGGANWYDKFGGWGGSSEAGT